MDSYIDNIHPGDDSDSSMGERNGLTGGLYPSLPSTDNSGRRRDSLYEPRGAPPPFDPSQLISLNWSPLLAHIQNLSSFIESNQRKINDVTRRVQQLEEENKALKDRIALQENEEAKENHIQEIERRIKPLVKKWNDDSKTHLEHQITKLGLRVDKDIKTVHKSIEESVTTLQAEIVKEIDSTKSDTNATFGEQLHKMKEEFEHQITDVKEEMKVDLSGLIVEKKAEIVKESFDDSGLKDEIEKLKEDILKNTEAIKLLDDEFADRVKRLISLEMKNVKQTTVKTILQQTATQNSRLKYYVRNLYALLRLDMKKMDEVLNDYEISEHKNPIALMESMLLQKKCSNIILSAKPILSRHSQEESDQDPSAENSTENDEDAEIRLTPGTITAIEYIYKKLPLHNLGRRFVEDDLEKVRDEVKKLHEDGEEKTNHKFAHVEKILESKVSKILLSEALKDNDVILNIKDDFSKIDEHVNHILETFMTREQIYSCLRLKADVTQMNLKADRKFLNGVFDYLNEKITLLSSETNNQQLLSSIKLLEQRLRDLNRSAENGATFNMTGMETVNGDNGLNTSGMIPGLNLSQTMDQSVLGSANTKCLSCNRPFSGNQKSAIAQKSKWQEYPPSLLPSLNLSMDSGRRLESYRHMLSSGDKKSQVLQPQVEGDDSFLGGGFKHLSPIKPSSTTLNSSQQLGSPHLNSSSLTTTMHRDVDGGGTGNETQNLVLDLSRMKQAYPPNTARNNIRNKIIKDRQKSSSARPSTASHIPDKLKSKFDYTSMALGDVPTL